jgi:hypothetical protein
MGAAIQCMSIHKETRRSVRSIVAELVKNDKTLRGHSEAIRSKIRRLETTRSRAQRELTLSEEEEETLVNLCKVMAIRTNGLTSTQLLFMANYLHEKDKPLTTGWLQSFLKRHKSKIKIRQSKKSHKKSILASRVSALREWVRETAQQKRKCTARAELNFNIDESKALPKHQFDRIVAGTNLSEAQRHSLTDKSLYTIVPCISGSGKTLFVLYIIKSGRTKNGPDASVYIDMTEIDQPEKEIRSTDYVPIYFAVTPSGYMNGTLWMQVMQKFIDLASLIRGVDQGERMILWLDGCSAHLLPETMRFLDGFNCEVIAFPSDTSHIVQPADGPLFANYKQEFARRQQRASLASAFSGIPERFQDFINSLRSFKHASTPKVVQECFVQRGIFPFNPDLIITNAITACPEQKFVEAPVVLSYDYIWMKLGPTFEKLIDKPGNVERKSVESITGLVTAHDLPQWKRRSRTRKAPAKTTAAHKSMSSDESDEEESDGSNENSSEDEIVPKYRLQPLGPTSTICSHCDDSNPSYPYSSCCTICNSYFLCGDCKSDPKVLLEHMQIHISSSEVVTRFRKNRR